MRVPADIRHIFSPIQPVHRFGDSVKYLQLLPALALRPYIISYWELKSNHRFRENLSDNIISDGCIDIFFEMNRPTNNFVMGFSNKSTLFQFGCSFHYIGVRFSPGMFPYFFRVSASEFSDKVENLSLIHRQTAEFIAKHVVPGQGLRDLTSLFDKYFLKILSGIDTEVDSRLYHALLTILQKPATRNLEKDIYRQVALSPRHLRRLFDYYIGGSVKSFSKVVRFQNYLRAHLASDHSNQNLYFDFGYYDQSHFIKEFKTFYGSTPGAAFKSESPFFTMT